MASGFAVAATTAAVTTAGSVVGQIAAAKAVEIGEETAHTVKENEQVNNFLLNTQFFLKQSGQKVYQGTCHAGIGISHAFKAITYGPMLNIYINDPNNNGGGGIPPGRNNINWLNLLRSIANGVFIGSMLGIAIACLFHRPDIISFFLLTAGLGLGVDLLIILIQYLLQPKKPSPA